MKIVSLTIFVNSLYFHVPADAKRDVVKPPSDDEREDREDELPTVVVLKSGDVSQEEFMEYRKVAEEKGG